MYLKAFGLKDKPFAVSPDPRFLYLSRYHLEALEHLKYGIRERMGFIVITGEVGTGKSTLLRALLEEIGSDTSTAFIFNTRLTPTELLKLVLNDLGLDAAGLQKDEMVQALNEFLLEQLSQRRNTVVVIDEAQNLHPEVLEELRLLSNLETAEAKLLQIVLVGQPELNYVLNLPQLRQLRQRITVTYHLQPLSQDETGEYIRHRLSVAGCSRDDLFTNEAIQSVYYHARGVPRLVNILCDRALLGAYADDKTQVDRALIEEVQREIAFPFAESTTLVQPWTAPAAAAEARDTTELQERLRKLDRMETELRDIRASLKNLENLLNFTLWVERSP